MYSFLLSFLENHRRVHSKYVDLPPGLRSSDPAPIKGSKPAESHAIRVLLTFAQVVETRKHG